MSALGAELCGQVSFGGDPLWADARAAASCSARALSGLQRILSASAGVCALCRSAVILRRCPQAAAFSQGRAEGTGRFAHVVCMGASSGGSAEDAVFLLRIGRIAGAATAGAGASSGLRRIVQEAAVGLGKARAEGLCRRCPQGRSGVAGMARAWFVPIRVMGGTEGVGLVCRLVQPTLDARVLSVQAARCVRLCRVQALAEGGNAASARAAALLPLPVFGGAGAEAGGRLSGAWGLSLSGKAQASVEVFPVRLVPLHPVKDAGKAEAVAEAHRLVDGMGPELSFAASPARSGRILFEVGR